MASSSPPDRRTRLMGFAWVLAAYLVALGLAILSALPLPAGTHPLVVVAVGDLVGTVAIFAFSFVFRNSSFYDPYWSVAPVPIALYLASHPQAVDDAVPGRQVVAIALVTLWGLRLTWNWARGWTGLHHEDWRYGKLREDTGKAYWLVSFSGIHLFPTVLVYLGCLGLYPALLAGSRPFGLLDLLAAGVTAGAVVIEGLADDQLRAFVRRNRDPNRYLDTGLWAWSRHPNYFGEVSFWWGVWLFGLAADPSSAWWTAAGPLAMTGLFVFISIPMMEKRMVAKRPAYAEHQRRVSMLVPLPPRRRRSA